MPRQELPQIDARLCTHCGDCVKVCPTDCLHLSGGLQVIVAAQDCISCAVCAVVCPVGAIAMRAQAW
jgi:formate hydrogenlyase subunit 6/NADH:ubiquinone oxidoreductase subunit I